MKAIQIDKYQKELKGRLVDLPKPKIKPEEVLIKVKATALNPLDILIMRGEVKLIVNYKMPLIIGNECSGEVVEVGALVRDLKVGDKVYTRLPLEKIGALAEYIAVPAKDVALMPSGYDFARAAAIPLTGLTAYQALCDYLKVESGKRLLITGGSGSFGQLAVPLAKYLGLEVIVTGNSANKNAFLALGADRYLDYTKENYWELLNDIDYVIDTLGASEFKRELSVLKKGGKLLSLRGMPNKEFAKMMQFKGLKKLLFSLAGHRFDSLAHKEGKKYYFMFVKANGEQLKVITGIVEQKKIMPAIEDNWQIEDFNEAINRLAKGQNKGKIIIEF